MASKRARRRNQCSRKRRHPTHEAAEAAARRLSAVTSSWIVGYTCSYCGQFHTGHPPAHVRRARHVRR